MAKDRNVIEPIDAGFEDVARKMVIPAAHSVNKINNMMGKCNQTPATPRQGVLDLGVEIERVIAGVEMGVLENGMPETKASISNKISRGSFTAAFFVASMKAIGCQAVRVDDV